jgi:hypothetical protein
MLQVFHLNVAYVCKDYIRVFKFFLVFASVSDICCKCFNYFERMLQVFHMNIAKVNRGLHMLQGNPPVAYTYCSCLDAIERAQMVPRACAGKWRGRERSPRVVRWHEPSAWVRPRYGPTDRCPIGRPGASSSHDYFRHIKIKARSLNFYLSPILLNKLENRTRGVKLQGEGALEDSKHETHAY